MYESEIDLSKKCKKVEKMSKVTQIFRKSRKVKVAGHDFASRKFAVESRSQNSHVIDFVSSWLEILVFGDFE